MALVRGANLALAFLVELAAFAAFAVWGANAGHGAEPVLLGIAAPAAVIVFWSRFCAPRSDHRLPVSKRIPVELAVFALAALALSAAGHGTAAILLAAVVLLNAALLSAFGQWGA